MLKIVESEWESSFILSKSPAVNRPETNGWRRRSWAANGITFMAGVVSKDKLKECRPTLLGQLHKSPTVNFQAFQNTMRKGWGIENVAFTQMETRCVCFYLRFWGCQKKKGCWSFGLGPLLIICYSWSHENQTPFLMAMSLTPALFGFKSMGSLLEWISEEAVRRAAYNIGFVSEVKVEAKGFASIKIGEGESYSRSIIPIKMRNHN